MGLINSYTTSPDKLKDGDQALYVIKLMVAERDGQLYYRLYRCPHAFTPGQITGHYEMGRSIEENIPQGDQIIADCETLSTICRHLFPVAFHAGAVPDIY